MMVDKIINTAYSFGAAIVVFGAWAKMEHKSYSDDALTARMMTEVAIFFLYGFLEWRKRPAASQQPELKQMTVDRADLNELNTAVRQTNSILNRVFR